MKLKILLLVGMGLAGLGASYALADAGHGRGKALHKGDGPQCRRIHLLGTVAAPQTLTVAVARAGKKSSFSSGDTVTVQLGSSGQSVRVNVVGCVDVNGSTLSANGAVLQVVRGKHGDGNHGTVTVTTTVTNGAAPAPETQSESTETETGTTTTDAGTTTGETSP